MEVRTCECCVGRGVLIGSQLGFRDCVVVWRIELCIIVVVMVKRVGRRLMDGCRFVVHEFMWCFENKRRRRMYRNLVVDIFIRRDDVFEVRRGYLSFL